MKKNYAVLFLTCLIVAFVVFACSKSDDDNYEPVTPVSPVVVDLTQVPYPKLSDYKFFDGELKDQIPALDVLPFEPASALFTDYALKKRFIWMPKGTKATYNGDGKVIELPVGAALIKTFYYDNVQPANTTRIIETRVMIRKADGWIFAEYVWNDEQTEAVYNMAGSFTPITWKDEHDVIRTTDYRIPSEEQCIVCHKSSQSVDNQLVIKHIPIGIKPQNLNFNLNYADGSKNQLTKWIEAGYLEGNFTMPTESNTTVDYRDGTKSVEVRARSYVDINCAHCHQAERHCDYRPMRFAFNETAGNEANMGVCVNTEDMQGFPSTLGKIVTPRNVDNSMMYYRLNTTNETYRMPLHGRTLIHDEGLALIRDWINELHDCE
ncbi:MAG TPA: hypothetical protein VF676_02885 [Flavobacterium sp.]|jgi:uncharacterized repeat protein (TIGR03806 family)